MGLPVPGTERSPVESKRQQLLAVYQAALEAVQGRRLVAAQLQRDPIERPCRVVAIGKAASSMLQGALEALGERAEAALLITKHGHLGPVIGDRRVQYLEAGHPLPDQHSLQAGQALLDFIAASPETTPLLFLLSGGSSSLVEVLPAGLGLPDLVAVNDWLLASGWDIHAMNRVRKALSCIKGGRLARYLAGRPARLLALSDVPGDILSAIGSGPLAADPQPLDAALRAHLPDWVQGLLDRAPAAPTVEAACFQAVEAHILAGNRDAREAAAAKGQALGWPVHIYAEPLQGDALEAGRELARCLLEGPAGLHVWGGETTVRLPAEPGRGGRCQSLALAAALELQGRTDCLLLAAGSDGSDGPGDDAGALVDGGSVARGLEEGLDPERCLAGADAGRFLEASGDLINTGPTGSNVMDLVLGYKPEAG